jgi:DNA replication protein DnaC
MTITDFTTFNESQEAALEAVTEYLKGLDDCVVNGRGLTFLGPSGVGKTMLASIVLNEAAQSGYRIEAIELARYVGLHKDLFSLGQLMKHDDDDEIVDQYVKVRQHIRHIQGLSKRCADWLLLDDVGREYPSESGWSQGEFFDTVRSRWNRGLPTLLTTNLPMPDLEQRYTEGLTSVLLESSTIITLEGDDYRCRKAT